MNSLLENIEGTGQKRHAIAGVVLFWTILIVCFVLLANHSVGYKPWGSIALICVFPAIQLITILKASPVKYRTISQLFASSVILGFIVMAIVVAIFALYKGEMTNDYYLFVQTLMIFAISLIYGCGITGMLMFYAFADIKENPFYNFWSRK